MKLAVCPGSFDPLHHGHVEIITRAATLFSEVVVAVSANPAKKPLFGLPERMDMAREVFQFLAGVTVEAMDEPLLADFARRRGAAAVVKGLREDRDYAFEAPMATMNRHLGGVETVFLAGDPKNAHLSSSLIKEVHGLGGDVSDFVPRAVLRRLEERRAGSGSR